MPTLSIYFSYAWNDATKEDREIIIDDLFSYFKNKNYQVVRDKQDMTYKDSISDFIDEIGKGNLIVVGISDKYLKSTYCMTELNKIYQRSDSDPDEFIQKIFPIQLEGLELNKPAVISAYLSHWEKTETEWEALVKQHTDIGDYYEIFQNVKQIRTNIADLIAFLSDRLIIKAVDYSIEKQKLIQSIESHYQQKITAPQGFMDNQPQQKPAPIEQPPNTTPPSDNNKKRGCTFSIAISLCGIGIVAAFFLLTTNNESTPNNQSSSPVEMTAPSMAAADSASAPADPIDESIPKAGFAASKVDTATKIQHVPTIIAKAAAPIPPKMPPATAVKPTSKKEEQLIGMGNRKTGTSKPPIQIKQKDSSTFLLAPIDNSNESEK
ncbi:MAG: TIR domain-containing protein [Chitinophagaceae bacterium]|nr:TIR domain-containing protein [Chitinophagaceae bacterium]